VLLDKYSLGFFGKNCKSLGFYWDARKYSPWGSYSKNFTLVLSGGNNIWVDGNAAKNIAEYAASKAADFAPESERLASQVQLESLASAVNATFDQGSRT
jgi:hypothetical protein